jgi:twitching motility protein PilU
MDFTPYLEMMVRQKASDLFLSAGCPVRIKIEGQLRDVGEKVYSPEMCREAVCSLMQEEQIADYDAKRELDFAVGLEGKGRFRINAFHQRGTPAW